MILYQTPLWQQINEHIFHKPVTYCHYNGKKYQIIIKDKKIGSISQKRAQIIGVEDISIIDELACEIQKNIPNLIYIQFGLSVILESENLEDLLLKKTQLSEFCTQKSHTTFLPSVVENMPEATIIIQVDQSIEELSRGISSTHHRRIKKAQKSGGMYVELQDDEVNLAYEMRHNTSKKQGFVIPQKKHFLSLCKNIISSKTGFIAARKQGDRLGAFAVILIIGKTRFYLYGGSDTTAGVGSAQSLHRQIIQNAHYSGIEQYDLLGVSPKGQPNHHLAGVTQFKQGFGGKRTEYLGNYDYLLSGRKYRLYKLRRNLRK